MGATCKLALLKCSGRRSTYDTSDSTKGRQHSTSGSSDWGGERFGSESIKECSVHTLEPVSELSASISWSEKDALHGIEAHTGRNGINQLILPISWISLCSAGPKTYESKGDPHQRGGSDHSPFPTHSGNLHELSLVIAFLAPEGLTPAATTVAVIPGKSAISAESRLGVP